MSNGGFPTPDPTLGNNLFFDPFFQQQQFIAFDQDYGDLDEGEIYENDDGQQQSEAHRVGQQDHTPKSADLKHGATAEYNPSQPLLSSLDEAIEAPPSKLGQKPPTVDKAANEERAKDLRARLMASRRTTTPASSAKGSPAPPALPLKNGLPTVAAISSAPASSGPISSSILANQATPGQEPKNDRPNEIDDLLEQGKAAAAAAENLQKPKPQSNVSTPKHKQVKQQPGGSAASSTQTNLQASQKAAEATETSARNGKKNKVAATAKAKTSPKMNEKKSQAAPKAELSMHSTSKDTSPQSRQQITSSPSLARVKEPELSRINTELKRPVSPSKYYEDVEEWLEYTGYHDVAYRRHLLDVRHKRKSLFAELEKLDKEEELSTSQFRSTSVQPEISRGRSTSAMPPPPLPPKYQNGNVTSSHTTPVDTPLSSASSGKSDFKRPRSPNSLRARDAPPKKLSRSEYIAVDRRGSISGDSPHLLGADGAASPTRNYRRFARSLSPRGPMSLDQRDNGGSRAAYPYYPNKTYRPNEDRNANLYASASAAHDYDKHGSGYDSYQPQAAPQRGRGGHRGKGVSSARGDRGARRGR